MSTLAEQFTVTFSHRALDDYESAPSRGMLILEYLLDEFPQVGCHECFDAKYRDEEMPNEVWDAGKSCTEVDEHKRVAIKLMDAVAEKHKVERGGWKSCFHRHYMEEHWQELVSTIGAQSILKPFVASAFLAT